MTLKDCDIKGMQQSASYKYNTKTGNIRVASEFALEYDSQTTREEVQFCKIAIQTRKDNKVIHHDQVMTGQRLHKVPKTGAERGFAGILMKQNGYISMEVWVPIILIFFYLVSKVKEASLIQLTFTAKFKL